MRIHPVILSGGSGTRLWPLSRALYPKQLLPLVSRETMLQETVARVSHPPFTAPSVICNGEHRFLVAEQLRAVGIEPKAIVLEPEGRNTAPAAAVAALMALESDPDALVMLLPSDHVIRERSHFNQAVEAAARAALAGHLVTFGIEPTGPETGYGYIRKGESLDGLPGCHKVARFVEKPDREKAETFLASGEYAWNSGMFLFSARAFLDELGRFQPVMLESARQSVAKGRRDLDFFRLDGDAFARCPSASIDVAVMERTDRAAVVPAALGWSDVGSWSALWEISEPDAQGNVQHGDVFAKDVSGSYLRSEGPMLAALGIQDMVVVATQDAVLVAPRDRSQDVKLVVSGLEESSRGEHINHVRVHRPWGWYETVDAGPKFQVKRICVNPGAKLSLQYHDHRAEHWVVVSGTAHIVHGEEELVLEHNQSTYIPIGVRHRLENPGEEPLHIIEVQSGDYLGEDDIVRLDDVYARS
jgi:mannose-1-phosphate guanylyltransferase/mannose-6-phosphate isomerase